MPYTYRYTFDESHVRTMLERFYRRQSFLGSALGKAILGGALLWWLLVFTSFQGGRWVFGAFVLAVYCIVAYGIIRERRTRAYQRFRYSASFGKNLTRTVTEDGLRTSIEGQEQLVVWPEFRLAARYPDGLLLLHANAADGSKRESLSSGRMAYWLPDAALVVDQPREVVEMLKSRIRVTSVD